MSRRTAFLWSGCLAGLAPLFLPMACVDTEPVVVEDVQRDAGADAKGPCSTCMEAPSEPGPGCEDALAVCNEFETCKATMDCAFEFGCLDLPTIPDILSCGIDCSEITGVVEDEDAVAALGTVFTCVVGPCAPSCGTGKADAGAN
jgi:hypothetical protein